MKIKFLEDFSGAEKEWKEGNVYDFAKKGAKDLINQGIAEPINDGNKDTEEREKESENKKEDEDKPKEAEEKPSEIELGPTPTDSLGITISIGNGWKLEVSKPKERYLVGVKDPDGKKLHELDYPEGFWAKQRKRKTLKNQIDKVQEIYGEEYEELPRTNEKKINNICLLISENTDLVREERGGEEKEKEEPTEEEEKDIIETSKVEKDDFLAEQIVNERGPAFTFINDGEVKTKKKITTNNTIIIPRNDKAVKSESILLPSKMGEYEDTKTLLEEIRELIHKYVDVSEKYEKLASWYVMTTWVYDELSTLCYLRTLGDTGTGKSRFLNVVGRICYKPIIVSGAVTPAPIYRLMEQWSGTLIIDEGDIRKSDAMNEVITILNCGFERGRPVIRCTKDNPDEIQFHRTFGPKLIATRNEFRDKALEGRCLTEKMSQTMRDDIPDQLPDEFHEKAQELRNRLLKWRFDYKDKVDVARSRATRMGNVEPRLKQATRSFLAVFDDEEIQKELLNYLEKHQRELVEQRARTWEGIVINIIYDYWKKGEEKLDGREEVWSKKIAENMEEEYGISRITPQKVGRIISSFDLETKRKRVVVDEEGNRRRVRCLVWDDEKLKSLFKRHVPELVDIGTGGTSRTTHKGRTEFSNGKESGGKLKRDDGENGGSTLSHSEGADSPNTLSQLSQTSQMTETELKEIDRLLSDGLARSPEDVADELDMELEKVEAALKSLYDRDRLQKKRGPDDEPFYAQSGGDGSE